MVIDKNQKTNWASLITVLAAGLLAVYLILNY